MRKNEKLLGLVFPRVNIGIRSWYHHSTTTFCPHLGQIWRTSRISEKLSPKIRQFEKLPVKIGFFAHFWPQYFSHFQNYFSHFSFSFWIMRNEKFSFLTNRFLISQRKDYDSRSQKSLFRWHISLCYFDVLFWGQTLMLPVFVFIPCVIWSFGTVLCVVLFWSKME